MIVIGPFWCAQDNGWLRVVLTEGKAQAEFASRSRDKSDLCTAWTPVIEKDYWVVQYDLASMEDLNNEGFRLLGGKLYQTNFIANRVSNLLTIKQYDVEGTAQPFKQSREIQNPFEGKIQTLADPVVFQSLPLTPEAQLDRAQDQEPRRQMALEKRQQHWLKWQKSNPRNHIAHANLSSFSSDQTSVLMSDLNQELVSLTPENYQTPEQYEEALDQALTQKSNYFYKAQINLAARTYFDREHNLNPEEIKEEQIELYDRKLDFFRELLRTELQQLREEFNAEPVLNLSDPNLTPEPSPEPVVKRVRDDMEAVVPSVAVEDEQLALPIGNQGAITLIGARILALSAQSSSLMTQDSAKKIASLEELKGLIEKNPLDLAKKIKDWEKANPEVYSDRNNIHAFFKSVGTVFGIKPALTKTALCLAEVKEKLGLIDFIDKNNVRVEGKGGGPSTGSM